MPLEMTCRSTATGARAAPVDDVVAPELRSCAAAPSDPLPVVSADPPSSPGARDADDADSSAEPSDASEPPSEDEEQAASTAVMEIAAARPSAGGCAVRGGGWAAREWSWRSDAAAGGHGSACVAAVTGSLPDLARVGG